MGPYRITEKLAGTMDKPISFIKKSFSVFQANPVVTYLRDKKIAFMIPMTMYIAGVVLGSAAVGSYLLLGFVFLPYAGIALLVIPAIYTFLYFTSSIYKVFKK